MEIKEAMDKKKKQQQQQQQNTVFILKCKNLNIKKEIMKILCIEYLNWKICEFYGKNIIKLVISKMSKSQVYSNTDFVEQNNILNFLQQQQTL